MTDEVNCRSIEIVESAAFFLVLEDDAPPFTANNDMEVRGRGEGSVSVFLIIKADRPIAF